MVGKDGYPDAGRKSDALPLNLEGVPETLDDLLRHQAGILSAADFREQYRELVAAKP